MFWVQSAVMEASSADLTYNTVVTVEAGNNRLDRYLVSVVPTLSRMRIKGLILDGHVRLGSETITEPSYRVKPGDAFTLTVPPARAAEPAAQAIPLDIVYEDSELIVVDKPAGLVVHPAPGNPDRTLVNALLAHVGRQLSGIGGVKRPGIVHRLDKDTSGLLVAAKTQAAHDGLAADFAARTIERAYLALVWGRPRPLRGRIEGAIGRDPKNRKKMAVVTRGGKPALTHYEPRQSFGDTASMLECRLDTGRTHQIRVHLTHVGHPVLGDPNYGRARRRRAQALPAPLKAALASFHRQALHAHRLGFLHPVTGKTLRFHSNLPLDIKELVSYLEEL